MTEVPVPVALEKTESRQLKIRWSDGFEQMISTKYLRENCPCATCIDRRMGKSEATNIGKPGELRVLSAAEARPLEIARMQPVGNYAYNIQFSDEHTSGIYTFDLLRSFDSGESVV